MKDYTNNYEDSNKFIKHYTIEDENITCELGTGKKYVIPYTKKDEKNIIKLMEKQVKNAKIYSLSTSEKILTFLQPLALPFVYYNFAFQFNLFFGIILFIITYFTIHYPIKYINTKKLKRDYEKNLLYLNNKNKIKEALINYKTNDITINHDPNLYVGIRKRAVNKINSYCEPKCPININTLDNYTLKDLLTLKDNIERINYFNSNNISKNINEIEEEINEKSNKDEENYTLLKKKK